MQSIRTALIGCGKVGQIHAAALRDLGESEFVAVCDRDSQRAAIAFFFKETAAQAAACAPDDPASSCRLGTTGRLSGLG